MLTVAYLANQFPVSVEPYVGEEIQELRRRGVRVIPGSVRRPEGATIGTPSHPYGELVYLQPVQVIALVRALWLILARWQRVSGLVARVLVRGKETPQQRLKALLHTWLGAYYAISLRKLGVEHIHVHHGYFGSWIGMVAARLLGIGFSLTLHGSDLLLSSAYLDAKLSDCRFCITISDYNRRYILEHFRGIDPKKIIVSRLGVDAFLPVKFAGEGTGIKRKLTLLAVGRLHAVKDHAFLVRACARLRGCGLEFDCLIAGEGPERQTLESLIRQNRLQGRVTLLGHVAREKMDALYRKADVVVLTSRSEGIPLVLMEAMARGLVVVAPAITGIPELVLPGRSGFLYQPQDQEDFVRRILFLQTLLWRTDRQLSSRVNWIRHAACTQVLTNFNRERNLNHFSDAFLQRIGPPVWSGTHENLVLQQI